MVEANHATLLKLAEAPRYPLGDLLAAPDVPRSPGLYAFWHLDELLYLGMVYRDPAETANPHAQGIRGRLKVHRRARLTSDFALFVALRHVIPSLEPDDQRRLQAGRIAAGELQTMTRDWIHKHIDFSSVGTDGSTARAAEAVGLTDGLPGYDPPLANPAKTYSP